MKLTDSPFSPLRPSAPGSPTGPCKIKSQHISRVTNGITHTTAHTEAAYKHMGDKLSAD